MIKPLEQVTVYQRNNEDRDAYATSTTSGMGAKVWTFAFSHKTICKNEPFARLVSLIHFIPSQNIHTFAPSKGECFADAAAIGADWCNRKSRTFRFPKYSLLGVASLLGYCLKYCLIIKHKSCDKEEGLQKPR